MIRKKTKRRFVRIARAVRNHARIRTRIRALLGDRGAKRENELAAERLKGQSEGDAGLS